MIENINSEIEQILNSTCLNCNKKGFRWARNYCSYCGNETSISKKLLNKMQRLREEKDILIKEKEEKLYQLILEKQISRISGLEPMFEKVEKCKNKKNTISENDMLLIEDILNSTCLKCKKTGYKWARDYCSYCGTKINIPEHLTHSFKELRALKDNIVKEEEKKLYRMMTVKQILRAVERAKSESGDSGSD